MNAPNPSTNIIALITLVGAVGLMTYLFAESRGDPSLRIAALVAGTGLVLRWRPLPQPFLPARI